jgi:hypothetical protein
MPLSYRIDPEQRLVTITGDYAEPGEWRTLLTDVLHDPAYRPGSGFLRDLRASAHPVSAEAVIGIIAVVREFWPQLQTRRAAILTGPGVDIPAVIAHALADHEGLPLRAFNRYDDALQWLNDPQA